MNRFILASLLTGCALLVTQAQAQTSTATKPAKSSSKPAAKAAPAAKTEAANDGDDDEGKTPDVTGSEVTEYNCDHGQKITLYRNQGDDKHIAMRWQKQIMRMRRVETSSGADRFENRRYGMLWIGIPAKSMLLDTKKGQQLANECRDAQQKQAHEHMHEHMHDKK